MKLILVMLSLMIMACGGPTVELKPKFEKGEIVIVEGEKYVIMYSHQNENSIIYEVYPINRSNNALYIKEDNISKYINKIEE